MAGTTELTKRTDGGLRRRREWFDLDWPFPELTRWFEHRTPLEVPMRLEQETKDGFLVLRAELPGLDPDTDIEVTVDGDVLTITAERRQGTREEDGGTFRTEFRYGSSSRSMTLPKGVGPDSIEASYRDGILEVRVPVPDEAATTRKVAITRT